MARSEANFTQTTKNSIFKKSKYKCNICWIDTNTIKIFGSWKINIWQIAHIIWAGSWRLTPRWELKLKDYFKKSINNGILLCSICHKKLIVMKDFILWKN